MPDGMPRAYLRIDPNIDQHPDALGMLLLLCAAHRQPDRGRFRDRTVLSRAVGRNRVTAMLRRGDVQELGDGRFYVPGWDEWQEGDHTVAERMRRMRDRRRRDGHNVSLVTVPPSPPRNEVTTDAYGVGDGVSDGVGVGDKDAAAAAAIPREVRGFSTPREVLPTLIPRRTVGE